MKTNILQKFSKIAVLGILIFTGCQCRAESRGNIHHTISESRVFREPLAWAGETPPPEAESHKLWAALNLFSTEGEPSGLAALESFLVTCTNSGWAPSVRSVLAKHYRDRGRYTPALQHWELAWNATKDAKTGTAKQIADFTLVHWTRLLASLGRVEVLGPLFKQAENRPLDSGPLQQIFFGTQEGFRTMVLQPERSYRCGTYALFSLARALAHTNEVAELLRIESPATGFSMAELAKIWERFGLPLAAVRRDNGPELVIPSVVHWKQNHYAAIVSSRGNMFHVIDPTFGDSRWLTADAINAEASGAFIVTRGEVPAGWSELTTAEMQQIYGKGYPNGFVDDDDQPCEEEEDCEECPPGHGSGGGGPSGCTAPGGRCKPLGSTGANPNFHGHGVGGGHGKGGSGAGGFEDGYRVQGDQIRGMPQWRISEPYINVWVEDEPLGYQPARGGRVSFKLAYKQRDQVVRDTNWFSLGVLWNCSWLSHAAPDGEQHAYVYVAGGGKRRYLADGSWMEYNSNSRMQRLTNSTGAFLGYEVIYADGAKEVYGFLVAGGTWTNAFLTAKVTKFGHTNRFEYTNYANGVVRLLRIVDAQNQTNLIYYATNHPYSSNLIARVVDPFGRETKLEYDSAGHLTNVVDVANLSSSFAYDSSGWMTNLTTPYGSTRFQMTTVPSAENLETNNRSALITLPNGAKELYVFRDLCSSFLPLQYPDVPTDTPAYPDNWIVSVRNTFYWNRQQFAALPEAARTNIANLGTNDFKLARMRHWMHRPYTEAIVGQTMSIEREPSPTLDPLVEGQKTWYTYAPQVLMVEFKIQVPNNDTNRPSRYTYNKYSSAAAFYSLTNQATTYSAANGSRAERTKQWIYDTNNWIDVLQVIGPNGETEMQYGYNANHQLIGETNAVGYWTTYAYDSNGQITNVTRSSGLTTIYSYDANGYLTNVTDVEIGRSESFTYTNGLVYTHTDALGLTRTNTWDALQRLISVADANGYISNIYTRLDLTATRDKLGNWKYFTYDSLRQKIGETNELGRATTYSYCDCGALGSITDALGNVTSYFYDLAGRLTNVISPGLSVSYNYSIFSQLTNFTDSAGNSTTNWYNHQGLIVAVSNAFGRVQGTVFDIEDRPISVTDANGITVTSAFDALGRVLSRSYPDGGVEKLQYSARGLIGYTNQLGHVTKSTYDEAGRKIAETNANNEVTQFKYDPAGNLTNLIDGKNQNTLWKYDRFGRVTNKVDHTGADMFRYAYDANDRLTNRWSPAKTNTFYAYDAVGNLTNVDYAVNTDIRLAYDPNNRLTNMMDAVGTTRYAYTGFGAVLSEDGPWENDTVTYGYDNARRRSSLTLQQPNATAWAQSHTHDAMGRLATLSSPAGNFTYGYTAAGSLLKTILTPAWIEIANTYDSVGRQTETRMRDFFSWSPISTNYFVYDQAGRRMTNARNHHVWTRYSYDDIGQLKQAYAYQNNGTLRGHERFDYSYDAAGNLSNKYVAVHLSEFRVNALNQLTNLARSGNLSVAGVYSPGATNVTLAHNGNPATNATRWADYTFGRGGYALADGTNTFTAVAKDEYGRGDTNTCLVYLPASISYAYDANGNLTYDGHKALEYDDENQLIRLTATNSWRSDFVYDGKFRRRTRREFTWQNGTWVLTNEVRYVYDGNLEIQSRDAFNVPTLTLTRGIDLSGTFEGAGGIGGLLARTDHSTPNPHHAYFHADANGNVIALIDINQVILARYAYEPFGRVFSMSGPLAEGNLYRFSSKEFHPPSGLIAYTYRPYEPVSQRWTSRDPLGELGFEAVAAYSRPLASDSPNPYQFVLNDPIRSVDAFGLARSKNTGVKICNDPSGIHAWLEYPGGSAGFYPSGSIFGSKGVVISPDPHTNDPKKTCKDFHLRDGCYDFDKFSDCVKNAANAPPGTYCVIGSNCGNWVNKVLNDCAKKARKKK